MKKVTQTAFYHVTRITAATAWIAAVMVPISASASQLGDILNNIKNTLDIIMRILITCAFIVFIWGIVKFIAAAGNPQQIKQAKGIMLYGILGLAVLAMMTGIITLLQTYLGISPGNPVPVPQF